MKLKLLICIFIFFISKNSYADTKSKLIIGFHPSYIFTSNYSDNYKIPPAKGINLNLSFYSTFLKDYFQPLLGLGVDVNYITGEKTFENNEYSRMFQSSLELRSSAGLKINFLSSFSLYTILNTGVSILSFSHIQETIHENVVDYRLYNLFKLGGEALLTFDIDQVSYIGIGYHYYKRLSHLRKTSETFGRNINYDEQGIKFLIGLSL